MFRSLFLRLVGVLLCLGFVAPAWADTYTKTKYPIMLVHGLFGFDSLLGVYDYWYGIPSALRSGGATVYAASVSASNDSTVRGEQLIHDLDTLRALHPGYTRFNLIGHSQGGPTARYVASVRPDLVASVTSIGSPHTGSAPADAIAAVLPSNSPLRPLVVAAVDAFSTLIGALSGNNDPQDALAALTANSTAGATAFNALHPEGLPPSSNPCGQGAAVVNGIRYYSMGGTSVATNIFDVSDPALIATSVFFWGAANDGLVGQCASHLGVVLKDNYGWNHLDEVNQIFGLRGLFSADPASVIRAQANRLQSAGL